MVPTDSWYRNVPYQGAFSRTSNWLYGWTYLDEGGYLVEQNDMASTEPINVSTRQNIQPGDSVTAGFFLLGELPRAVLIRAVGAKQADPVAGGVANAASDTVFYLYKGAELVATIDDWGESGDGDLIASISKTVGAYALTGNAIDDITSAVGYFILEPGFANPYSVIATHKDGTATNVLIEVYDVDAR